MKTTSLAALCGLASAGLVLAGCATAPGSAPAAAPATPAPAAAPSPAPAPAVRVEFPEASPGCDLRQHLGLTDIDIAYSRPGVKGRVIFGGIVPYGAVWRTGANASTKISFSTAAELDGHRVPPGTYALYTIPGRDVWTIILDKDTHLWGAYGYDARSDLLRFDVRPAALLQRVETFTIEFANIRDDSADLELTWEHTRVPIHVTVDVVPVVSAELDRALADGRPKKIGFYLNAASFYFQHGPDLDKALQMANAAIALNTPATFEAQFLKAEILEKQGDKAGAAEAARASRAGALKNDGPNSSYLRMNDDLLARLGQ
ncbi:MAG TPA: DUF2911 domain-containing protein [Opitutaceae bacterium]|jgi:hypothetical protein|nr:DUF2911 domain-containing protein [Opitutaceae bacterium]